MSNTPPCLHCAGPCRARRRRGLCRRCHAGPATRRRYPLLGTQAGLGAGDTPRLAADFIGPAPPPPAPTRAEPGSPRKLAELVERARQRVDLHHDRDTKLTGADAGDGSRRRLAQLTRLAFRVSIIDAAAAGVG